MTAYLAFGPNGSGKSTFALSGAGRKWYAEFDPGSFDRTGYDAEDPNLDLHFYPPPLQSLLDMGKLDLESVGRSGRGGVQVTHKLVGWTEVYWQGFVQDFLNALTADEHDDYIFDTGKMLWEMCRNTFRQRVQQETDLDERRRLVRLDYQEPNMQHHQLIQGIKARQRNLVIVSHQTEVWENNEPTGRFKPDGWNEAEDEADCTLRFYIKGRRPVGVIHKAGAGGLDLIGMEVEEPTIEKMNRILGAAAFLRRAGVPLAGVSAADVVATAEAMK